MSLIPCVAILLSVLVLSGDGYGQRGPQVTIDFPISGSRHNYFPKISGHVYSSDSTSVTISIQIFSPGNSVWDGKNWVSLSSTDFFLGSGSMGVAPTVSGNEWSLKTLPRQLDAKNKGGSYWIKVEASNSKGLVDTQLRSISISPIEVFVLDANERFTGTDFVRRKKRLGDLDAERYLNLIGSRFLSGAVTDGASKLLVIAKGKSYGSVTFETSADVGSYISDIETSTPARYSIRTDECNKPMSAELRLQTTVVRKIPDKYRLELYRCTTGDVPGGAFSFLEADSPAVDVLPYEKREPSEFYWFALYTVPPYLPADKPNSILGHFLAITANFTPLDRSDRPLSDDSLGATKRIIRLRRPPVILVHGVNDNAGSWQSDPKTNSVLRNAGFDVRAIDYKQTNSESFETNKEVILHNPRGLISCNNGKEVSINDNLSRHASGLVLQVLGVPLFAGNGCTIGEVLWEYRSAGIAISRVDIVAHSMGGLLARMLYQQPSYRSSDNFWQGYIRRLITIGTPHFGSNIANVVIANSNSMNRGVCTLPAVYWETGLRHFDAPANTDLAIGSRALSAIKETKVLAHAITTRAWTLRDAYLDRYKEVRLCPFRLNGMIVSPQELYVRSTCADKPCDMAVTEVSAAGGLRKPGTVTSFPNKNHPEEIMHGEQIRSSVIREKVKELLMGDNKPFDPDGFPSVASQRQHFPPNSLDPPICFPLRGRMHCTR